LVRFDALSDARQTDRLRDAGLRVLAYAGDGAWFVRWPGRPRVAAARAVGVRAIAPVERAHKMTATLAREGPGAWSWQDDGTARWVVCAFVDADLDELARDVEGLGGRVTERDRTLWRLHVALPPDRLEALADHPAVRWVEEGMPPAAPDNDGMRAAVQANALQVAPYGLSGAGVTVAIWESGGIPDVSHSDITGRLNVRDAANATAHGTHVAGILGGDGTRSAYHGGSAGQWRGVAPQVAMLAYDVPNALMEHTEALAIFNAVVSQNSWGYSVSETGGTCDLFGRYTSADASYDAVVRGAYVRPVQVVFSAGNDRNDGDCGLAGGPDYVNYGTINPPKVAKNVLTVGAIHSDTLAMTSFSNWGPTDDGRIKPELVAPGDQWGGDGGIASCSLGNDYATLVGTSMAAPVASGALALLVQQHRLLHGTPDPPPALLRCLLVHTALDLDDATSWFNRGPDFASGYGLLQARAAVDHLCGGGFATGNSSHGSTSVWTVAVSTTSTVARFTLVWDDPPAVENAAVTLVNDLDLIVRDPDGVRHFPWTLDPAAPAAPAVRSQVDRRNVIEQVEVDASVRPGLWTVQVVGHAVPDGPQPFAIAWSPVLPAVRLDVTAGAGGVIAPSGTVWLARGDAVPFAVEAEAWYHLAGLETNGTPVAGVSNLPAVAWAWSNVWQDGAITASFAPDRTSQGVPHAWLHAHGLGPAFEAVAAGDADRDGAATWLEFSAGTDPTNRLSVLRAQHLALQAPSGWLLRWPSVSGRVYRVETADNPDMSFAVWSNAVPATPPTNTLSLPDAPRRAVRLGVRR
jgi:hypothetical protein